MPSDEVVVHLERTELTQVAKLRTLGCLRVFHPVLLLLELEEQIDLHVRSDFTLSDFVRESRVSSADRFVNVIFREMAREDATNFLQKIRPSEESSLDLESSL